MREGDEKAIRQAQPPTAEGQGRGPDQTRLREEENASRSSKTPLQTGLWDHAFDAAAVMQGTLTQGVSPRGPEAALDATPARGLWAQAFEPAPLEARPGEGLESLARTQMEAPREGLEAAQDPAGSLIAAPVQEETSGAKELQLTEPGPGILRQGTGPLEALERSTPGPEADLEAPGPLSKSKDAPSSEGSQANAVTAETRDKSAETSPRPIGETPQPVMVETGLKTPEPTPPPPSTQALPGEAPLGGTSKSAPLPRRHGAQETQQRMAMPAIPVRKEETRTPPAAALQKTEPRRAGEEAVSEAPAADALPQAESTPAKTEAQLQAEAQQVGEVGKMKAAQAEQQLSVQAEESAQTKKQVAEQEGDRKAEQERSKGEADKARKQAEGEAQKARKQAEGEAQKARKQSEGEAEKARTQSEGEANKARKRTQGETEKTRRQKEAESQAAQRRTQGEEEAQSREAQGEREAQAKRAQGDAERRRMENEAHQKKGLWDTVTSAVSSVFDTLMSAARKVWDTAVTAARQVMETARAAARSIRAAAAQAVQHIREAADKGIWHLMETIAQEVQNIARTVAQAVRNVAQSVAQAIRDIGRAVEQAIRDVARSVEQAIRAIASAVEQAVRAAYQWVAEKVAQIGAWLHEQWEKFKKWAEEAFVKFWTGPWRDILIGVAVALLCAAVTVLIPGGGILLAVAISAAATGALRGGGELLARRAVVDIKSDPARAAKFAEEMKQNGDQAAKWYDGVKENESWMTSLGHAGVEAAHGAVEGAISGLAGGASGALGAKVASAIGKKMVAKAAQTVGSKVVVNGLQWGARTAVDAGVNTVGNVTTGVVNAAIDVGAGHKTWDEAWKERVAPLVTPGALGAQLVGSGLMSGLHHGAGPDTPGAQDRLLKRVFGGGEQTVRQKVGQEVTAGVAGGTAGGIQGGLTSLANGGSFQEGFTQGFAGGVTQHFGQQAGEKLGGSIRPNRGGHPQGEHGTGTGARGEQEPTATRKEAPELEAKGTSEGTTSPGRRTDSENPPEGATPTRKTTATEPEMVSAGLSSENGTPTQVKNLPEAALRPSEKTEAPGNAIRNRPEVEMVAERPVKLGQEEHTLKARRVGERVELWICSDCGPVLGKIDRILGGVPEGPTTRDLRERLTLLRDEVANIQRRYDQGEISQEHLPQALQAVESRLGDLSTQHADTLRGCLGDLENAEPNRVKSSQEVYDEQRDRFPLNDEQKVQARREEAAQARRELEARDRGLEQEILGKRAQGEPIVVDRVIVGAGFAAAANANSLPAGSGRTIAVAFEGNSWEGRNQPMGQRPHEYYIPGLPEEQQPRNRVVDPNKYMETNAFNDAVAMARHQSGIETLMGGKVTAIEDGAPHARHKLVIEHEGHGTIEIHTNNTDLTVGPGSQRELAVGDTRAGAQITPEHYERLVADGRVIQGDKQMHESHVPPEGDVAVYGNGASAAWNAAKANDASIARGEEPGRRVNMISRGDRQGDMPLPEGLRERLRSSDPAVREAAYNDPAYLAHLAEVDERFYSRSKLDRNNSVDDDHLGAFTKDAAIPREARSLTEVLPEGDNKVRLRFKDGPDLIVDQLVVTVGQDARASGGPMALIGDREMFPIYGDDGRVVGLQSEDGSIRAMGAAYTMMAASVPELPLSPDSNKTMRDQVQESIKMQALEGRSRDSSGVESAFTVMGPNIEEANRKLGPREEAPNQGATNGDPPPYKLSGNHPVLELGTERTQWPVQVEHFLETEFGIPHDQLHVEMLTAGRSGDPVFMVREGDREVGVFKVFRTAQETQKEVEMLRLMRSKQMVELQPVEDRGTTPIKVEGKPESSALLMESANGSSVEKMIKSLPEREGRTEAFQHVLETVRKTARGMAEFHDAFAPEGNPAMMRGEKQEDASYVLNKVPQLEGKIPELALASIKDKLQGVAQRYIDSPIPATAYHGDANIGNFIEGADGHVRVIDVGTMHWSLDGDSGKGKKTGAVDLGRFMQSLESATDGKLQRGEVQQLQQAFSDEYFRAVQRSRPDFEPAITLFRADTEIAAIRFAKTEEQRRAALGRLMSLLFTGQAAL